MPKIMVDWEDEISGRDFQIEFDLNCYRENYGADADGNRGEMRTFSDLDGIEIWERLANCPENREHLRTYWLPTTEDFLKKQDADLMKRLDAWIEGDGMEKAEEGVVSRGEEEGDDQRI